MIHCDENKDGDTSTNNLWSGDNKSSQNFKHQLNTT